MAVAIDTSHLALHIIPRWQRVLDGLGGDEGRFQIHRVSAHATIPPYDSEIGQQQDVMGVFRGYSAFAKKEALDWQADPDDDLGDAAVLHHLQQQAATVPFLSSYHGNSATTLTGTALSASINARTRGRSLSSFHRHSYRISSFNLEYPEPSIGQSYGQTYMAAIFQDGVCFQGLTILDSTHLIHDFLKFILWAGPKWDKHLVFCQVQVDMVDLSSCRLPNSRPRIRRRTAFNQFLQVSHSPVVEDTTRRNPLPHVKRFNGVRHRTDRNIWVAEMKPTKHKTKQDFGNFKSEVEAARAVDAAFHHYGRPELLNFPHTSLKFLSTRPTAPAGLDEKAKVKFVKEEAKLLLAAAAASSPLHSTHTTSTSLQIPELLASPRCCSPGPFRSFSEISSPLRCSGPDEVHAVVSQPQPQILHGSISEISTIGDLETVNSVGNAEQGWDWAEDSCTLAAPPKAVNPSTSESPSMWLDSILRSSPAPTYPRSPSPSHFQDEIALALLEHQSI